MKENFGVIRCSFHSNSELNKAVLEAFAIISPEEAPIQKKLRLKPQQPVKERPIPGRDQIALFGWLISIRAFQPPNRPK
jgi:hypothetical protein